MKVLILYYSKGGNTRKLAEAISEGVSAVDGVAAVLRTSGDVTKDDFVDADGLIVGSPVYFGTMAAQLKHVLDDFVGVRRKMENKVGAAFSTSGDATGGKGRDYDVHHPGLADLWNDCRGRSTIGDRSLRDCLCVGAPSTATVENGRKLGQRVAELVKKLNQ